jgi:hypothetical protein
MITLQNKLAKLANIATDLFIKEMNIYLTTPKDTPVKTDLHY